MDAKILEGEITSGRELIVQIPPDMPTGTVKVILLPTVSKKPSKHRTRRQTAHPAFGIWAKRKDIQDSASFATQLRQRLEKRDDGNRDAMAD